MRERSVSYKSLRLISLFFIVFAAGAAGAAEFALRDIHGVERRLSDYRGKWVVVNYWATWCPPCLEEIPELAHFHEQHKGKDAVVLGVNFEDIDLAQLREFIKQYDVTYPVLLAGQDVRAQPIALGPVPGLPTTYLVSPAGKVVAQNIGPITVEAIEAFIAGHKDPGAVQRPAPE